MAKNKIEIDVKVDDKGTTKKVALESKKAAKGLNETGKSARTADRNLKGAAQASANGSKNFSKMAQGISGGLVPAYATLAAQIFAVSAAFNFLKNAGNLITLQKGQMAYAASTGVAMRTLTNDIIAATDAQVSFQDAASAGAIGVAAGLSGEQLTGLGKAARDASVILGRDVTDSFNRLVRGVTKAEPELLDELGIILRLKDASEAYATALDLNANDLTQFQKTQAVTADVLAQAESKYSRIIAIVDPGVNKFAQLGKAFDDVVNKIKEFAAALAGPLANLLIEFPQIAYAGFALIGRGVLTAALPALNNFGTTMQEMAENSSAALEQTRLDVERLSRTIKLAKADPEAAAALAKQAQVDAKTALGAAGVTKGRKGSGIAAILGDQKLSARQLAATKRSAMAVQGIYKNMDDNIRRDFIRALDDMIVAQKVADGKMIAEAASAGDKIGLGYARLKAWSQKTFGGIVKFASKAAAVLSRLFFFVQIATMVFAAGKIAYDFFFKSNEQVDEAITKQTMLSDRLKSLNEDYQHFAEVQKVMLEDAPNALKFFENFSQVVGSLTSGQLIMLVEQLRAVGEEGFGALQKSAKANLKEATINTAIYKENLQQLSVTRGGLEAYRKTLEQAESAQKTLNTTLLEYVDKNDNATESEKEAAKFLGIQIRAYENMREEIGKTSVTGDAYIEMLNMFNRGEMEAFDAAGGVKELIKRKDAFLEVGAAIKEVGQIATQNKQQIGDFVRGLSGQNNESRLLQGIAKERELIGKQAIDTGEVDFKRLEQLKKEETLIKTILDTQYKIKLDQAKLEVSNLKALRGATKGQQARLKIDQNIAANAIKMQEVELASKAIREAAVAAGRGLDEQDERAIELNEQKLELIRQQNLDLERQKDMAVELQDTIKNSFESGFESGLADIIKGKVTSLKEAVATLATSMLESIADVLAKRLTAVVVDQLFPTVDPADKMKNALEEGGTIAAAKMKQAMTGETGVPGLEYITVDAKRKTAPNMESKGWFDDLLGTGRGDIVTQDTTLGSEGVTLNKAKGSLDNFLGSLGDIFNKNAEGGLVEKLGIAFQAGGNMFGDLFAGLGNMFSGLLSNLLGGLGGSGGGFASIISSFFATGGIAKGGFSTYASGGYAPGGFRAFASGGTVNKPTLGLVGEGKHNEAIVPLPDGKSIPVIMKGAGQQNNVTVNVSVDSNGNAQQNSQSNGQQGANLGNAIAAAVQKELQNQKRSGGILNPYGAA